MNDSKIYAEFAAKNGQVKFEGASYALTAQATLTNRMFNGWWGDAQEGDEYISEFSAAAMGEDGEEYVIRWQFGVIKGDEPDEDNHNWDDISEVIPA